MSHKKQVAAFTLSPLQDTLGDKAVSLVKLLNRFGFVGLVPSIPEAVAWNVRAVAFVHIVTIGGQVSQG